MKIKHGTNRIVILVGGIAIKVPHLFNGHYNFLIGCEANYGERRYCKMMLGVYNNRFYDLVAPSMFCSWFGLIQIQRRCVVNTVPLSNKKLAKFDNVRNGETKAQNFGYYKGKLVCLDYK